MTEPALTQRLRGSRLVARPKFFERARAYRNHVGRLLCEAPYADDLVLLERSIATGVPLPERFYRGGIDRDEDELLADQGISTCTSADAARIFSFSSSSMPIVL